MAYTTVIGTAATTEETTARTLHVVNMPATVPSGSWLMVLGGMNHYYTNSTWVNTTGGFTDLLVFGLGENSHAPIYVQGEGDYSTCSIGIWSKLAGGSEAGATRRFTTSSPAVGSFVSFCLTPVPAWTGTGGLEAFQSGRIGCPPSPDNASATSRGDHYNYTFISVWARNGRVSMLPKPVGYQLIAQAQSNGGTLDDSSSCGAAIHTQAAGTMPGSGGIGDGNGYTLLPGQYDNSSWQGTDKNTRVTWDFQLAYSDNIHH